MTNNPSNTKDQDGPPPSRETMLASYWAQFESNFPNDEACLEELYRRTDESTIASCHYCRGSEVVKAPGGRALYCKACQKNTWRTAGTFFHKIRRPRAWLGAIWLMEHGLTPSLLQFHKLADVAYSSAWNIFRKLSIVLESRMLDNLVAVPSSAFSLAISRRSRETPARAHPSAEIEELQEMRPNGEASNTSSESEMSSAALPQSATLDLKPQGGGEPDSTRVPDAPTGRELGDAFDTGVLTEREKQICDLLTTEPVHFDTLMERSGLSTGQLSAELTMLELSGIATCLPGAWYVKRAVLKGGQALIQQAHSALAANSHAKSKVLDSAIAFFRTTFHGISRKYLQLVVASYWCRIDRIAWPLGSLLAACHQSDPITDDDVLSYVSPMLIKISS